MERIVTHREEDIIRNWLETTEDIFDRIVLAEQMQPIVDKFIDSFSYNGDIYRGINSSQLNLRDNIIDMPLASYTHEVSLAREFRGWSEESMIVNVDARGAFNLTVFLEHLLMYHEFYDFTNQSMIEDRIVSETEVLYPFNKELIKTNLIDEGVA